MSTVRDSIEVAVPARVAYERLSRFENYPRFMSGMMGLTPLSDTSAHMVLDIGGSRAEFDALITESRPNEYLCWNATDGARVSEAVRLEELDDSTTRVIAELHADADQLMLTESNATDALNQRLKADLKGFKRFCEESAAGVADISAGVTGTADTTEATGATGATGGADRRGATATPATMARGMAASAVSHAVNERPAKGVPPTGNLGPILSNSGHTAPGRHAQPAQQPGAQQPGVQQPGVQQTGPQMQGRSSSRTAGPSELQRRDEDDADTQSGDSF